MRQSSSVQRSFRLVVAAMIGCILAPLPRAATPALLLPELDEVLVVSSVPWPLEDFLEVPQFENVVVSPGGTHLAATWQNSVNIVELPSLKSRRSGVLLVPRGVADLQWIDENRFVMQMDWPLRGLRPLREAAGTLLVADLEGKTLRELNPIGGAVATPIVEFPRNPDEPMASAYGTVIAANSAVRESVDLFQDQRLLEELARRDGGGPLALGPVRLVSARGSSPDQILFQTLWTGAAGKAGYGIFTLDLAECRQVRVTNLPVRSGDVVTGPGGRVALVSGLNESLERVVYFRSPQAAGGNGEDWELKVRSPHGERGLAPLAWTGEGENYYALDGRGLSVRSVVVWNADDDSREILYQNPETDINEAWLDPAGYPWVYSGGSHYPVYWYPDPMHPLARLHRDLSRRLPAEHVEIINATNDLSQAVVRISSGARPSVFILVDVATGRSITGMHSFPKLRGRRLSPVEAIEFVARDGLNIHGFLTTPLDVKGERRRGVPLLVIAHDGPAGEFPDSRYVADSRYEYERQLFASRGFAVLQVNVRGSTGRGEAFQRAGDGEWGGAVQDDYADAVRWAVQAGVAAEGKVCFYGTGFGAYSAMMTAARAPDLIQCVVGVAGVYDLPRLLETGGRQQMRKLDVLLPVSKDSMCFDMQTQIAKDIARLRGSSRTQVRNALAAINDRGGDSTGIPSELARAFGTDQAQIEARSPVAHASRIKAKVLLVGQYLDKHVPQDQLTAMRNALRSARNPPQTEVIGDERNGRNAGYLTAQDRTAAYRTVLEFLDNQIGN